MPAKYISFDSWWGGLNNIRMTYEMAAAISVITKRKLIIPPKIYCLFLSEHDQKETFFDFWELFDKELFYKYFDCVDYYDIKEYKKYESEIQYFDTICEDVKCLPEAEHPNWGVNAETYFTPLNVYYLNHEDKFIHFPRNLFGHWYHLIGGITNKDRQIIKYKLKHGLKLNSKYNTPSIPVPYNAIHVRSGDFHQTRPDSTVILFSNLREMVDEYLTPDKPLYIATDEDNRKLFECLNGYTCYYLSDFIQTDMVSSIGHDSIMCAGADLFYGSRYSTFTDYINIIRYYNGKKNCRKNLLNYKFNGNESFSWENCFVNEY
jgi:hypothetical protein